jgi:hypothetical protein
MLPFRTGIVIITLSTITHAGCTAAEARQGTVKLAIEPYQVPSGAEMVRCHEMALPAAEDIDIDRITWAFSQGKHHVHVYVSAGGESGAEARSYDCPQPVDFEKWHLLVVVPLSDPDAEWTLPEGVAIQVKARQSILIQTHYLNTGSAGALTAEGSVVLRAAAPGSVQKRAAAVFGQNRDIHVPPYASARVEGRCALPEAGDILTMIGHYHVHGRKFQSWVEARGKAPRLVYESEEAADLPWLSYDDLHIGPRDRLGWACEYDNDRPEPLTFGSLEDSQEHCNLFAYYTVAHGDAEFVPCVVGAAGSE